MRPHRQNVVIGPQAEQVGAWKTIIFCGAGTGLGLESSLQCPLVIALVSLNAPVEIYNALYQGDNALVPLPFLKKKLNIKLCIVYKLQKELCFHGNETHSLNHYSDYLASLEKLCGRNWLFLASTITRSLHCPSSLYCKTPTVGYSWINQNFGSGPELPWVYQDPPLQPSSAIPRAFASLMVTCM